MAPSNVENFSPHVIKQISRELCDLTQNPLEGIRVVFNEDDITSVQADIDGPNGTPYFGGSFRIRLVLGKNFPISPPKGFFVTKIFHPNVGRNGEICVNTLKKDWNQDLGLKHVLLTIKCLLIVPNPESALNEEAGKMILEQYEDYFKRAKMITEIHAPKAKITTTDFNDDCQQPSSSTVTNNNNTIINNINNNTTNNNNTRDINNSNNNTLFDKTASSSTSANINTGAIVGNGGQKQPLDGVCCSEEPVTKRLNSMLDCYNSTADQPQSPQQLTTQQSSQKSSVSTISSQSSTQSKVSVELSNTNKNRGLKRVLRLRS